MSDLTADAFVPAAGRISGILTSGEVALSTPPAPLLMALRHAARAVGGGSIPMVPIDPDDDQVQIADRIARAVGLHAVGVTLGDDTLGEAPAPVLAWRRGAGTPAEPVLLYRSGRRWRVADTASNWVPRPIQALGRDAYEPQALVILPMLPDAPVSAPTLLKYGLAVARNDLIAFLSLTIVSGGVLALLPLLTGPLFETVVPENESGLLRDIAIFFVVLFLGHAATKMAAGIAQLRITGRVGYMLRAASIDRAIRLAKSPDGGAALPPPPIASYAARSIERWHRGVWGMVLAVLSALLISLPSVAAIAVSSPAGAALIGGVAFVSLAFGTLIARRRVRALLDGLAAPQSWMSTAFEGLGAVDTVRASAAEARVFDRWTDGYLSLGSRFLRADRVGAASAALEGAIQGVLVLAAVVALAVTAAIEETQPIGMVVAAGSVAGAVTAMLGALSQATTLGLQYRMIRPLLEGVREPATSGVHPPRLSGRINLDAVTVRHSAGLPAALHAITVEITPGEHIGIAGPSGAGKSTLVRAILGMVEPESGSVTFDGLDIADLDLEAMRRQIGVVGQGGSLFAGTLEDNITAGEPLERAQVLDAANKAGLEDLLDALPLGLGTPIGDVDPGFSGGQVQRLLLARAFATGPKILILDEATSALDPILQQHVAFAIDAMDATVITVAHRLETLAGCDRVLMLDRGELVEVGSPAALTERGGLFAQLLAAEKNSE